MKRMGFLLMLLLLSSSLMAVDVDFDDFRKAYEKFSDDAANSLPYNTMVGLSWSDAYIGQFPHLGVGLTLGFTSLPYKSFEWVADALDVNFADVLPQIELLGAPIPAWTLDARLGGFVLPFDIGVKVGFLPDQAKTFVPDNMALDYLLLGGDIRYALLKGPGPKVSLGVGYNYLNGSMSMANLIGKKQEILDVGGYNLELDDPDLNFQWTANVIDLKAQASMNVLILTPSIGVGASYGTAQSGGGLETQILLNGDKIKDSEIKDIEDILGNKAPDLTDQSIKVLSDTTGWAFRVFGGASFNLLILRLDLTAMYNFTSGSIGAALNARVQF